MTRLRFVLADESIVKDDEVKKIKGVMSVVHGAGQYQIPIGTYVSDLCPVVKAKLGLTEDAMAAGKAKAAGIRFAPSQTRRLPLPTQTAPASASRDLRQDASCP